MGAEPPRLPFLIFRYLGKSWIESKFSERLASFEHQQDIEIQRLSAGYSGFCPMISTITPNIYATVVSCSESWPSFHTLPRPILFWSGRSQIIANLLRLAGLNSTNNVPSGGAPEAGHAGSVSGPSQEQSSQALWHDIGYVGYRIGVDVLKAKLTIS